MDIKKLFKYLEVNVPCSFYNEGYCSFILQAKVVDEMVRYHGLILIKDMPQTKKRQRAFKKQLESNGYKVLIFSEETSWTGLKYELDEYLEII